MTRITIDISRIEDQRLIEELLARLGIPSRVEQVPANGQQVVAIMQEIAESRSANKVEAPIDWQREIRQDRPLPFRN
ncbi:hypothetical protein [Tunicatimonas pelagia]|uniref:hypothetical protein n=1 Tax=Tunicatimonas pelagia TaxID=931531 RepID=UPI002665FAB8|nr:hypothetical protein [Tunicatimonas pelagia]WKN40743.1 hypothetical protein P0M28_17030 [Tunicatimonas pelagia]